MVPVCGGCLCKARFPAVIRQKLRLDLGGLGKSLFQDLGDAGVEMLATRLKKSAGGGILDQRVSKEIFQLRLRRYKADESGRLQDVEVAE